MDKYIISDNKRYYYFDTFDSYEEARNNARYYKRKTGSKYIILKVEAGTLFARTLYRLYLTRVMRLF